jgi:acetyltransferase-like isoleucine patch superfamily enzyme
MPAPWRSHGTGGFGPEELGTLGERVILEEGVLVFNPAYVHLHDDVYVGHRTMLKGDTRNELVVGRGSWIGQECFFHSAGGIRIGIDVGIAPRVSILTSRHAETPPGTPIIFGELEFDAVEIGDGCDIGIGAIILPGTRLATGVLVGAGAVVKGDFPDDVVIAGVPARLLRSRGESFARR